MFFVDAIQHDWEKNWKTKTIKQNFKHFLVCISAAPNAKMLNDINLNGNIALCPCLSFKTRLQYAMTPEICMSQIFVQTNIIHIIRAHSMLCYAMHYAMELLFQHSVFEKVSWGDMWNVPIFLLQLNHCCHLHLDQIIIKLNCMSLVLLCKSINNFPKCQ